MGSKLYYNGIIITMDGDKTAEAVLVRDGKIHALGTNAELLNLKDGDTEVVNLEGRTMLPAFIDSHSHLSMMASTITMVPLSDCTSMDEIVRKLSDFKAQNKLGPSDWLVGFGYDHNSLPGYAHPTAEVLDRVSVEIPVAISHTSGHMGVVNSKALAEMKIDRDTPNPQGGVIVKDSEGNPTGYLEENAFFLVQQHMFSPTPEQLARQLVQAQNVYASYGIVTVQEGMTSVALKDSLTQFAASGANKLDIVGYIDVKDADKYVPENPYEYVNGYRSGGFKLFLDGSPQGRTAWMSKPYENGDPDYCGYPIYSDEQVEGFVRAAIENNRQLLTHCNGDAASEQLIRCYSKVKKELGSTADLRPVMIHAQTVREDQLDCMAEIGMMASFFVVHTYYWGDVHLRNFGEQRGKMISPMRSAIERGVNYTIHQDAPVVPPDMMLSIWAAVNRRSKSGTEVGEGQCISVMDALRAVTCNAAYQYFEEQSTGSISQGKRANLVILDKNPLSIPKMQIKDICVLETIRDGETIFKK